MAYSIAKESELDKPERHGDMVALSRHGALDARPTYTNIRITQQGEKTPRREIEIAAARYRDLLAQEQEERDRR
jgi:hypothetical protein